MVFKRATRLPCLVPIPSGTLWLCLRQLELVSKFYIYTKISISSDKQLQGRLLTLHTGGIISGASPAYNVEEMTYALKKSEAKVLMTVPSSMEVALPAARNAGIPAERVLLIDGEKDGYTNMKQLLDIGKGFGPGGQVPSLKMSPGQTNKDICGFLSFSSGTTGLPKAVGLYIRLEICFRSQPFLTAAYRS